MITTQETIKFWKDHLAVLKTLNDQDEGVKTMIKDSKSVIRKLQSKKRKEDKKKQ